DTDIGLITPAEELVGTFGPGLVPTSRRCTERSSPPAIAVKHDRDVMRHPSRVERLLQAACIHAVQEVDHAHGRNDTPVRRQLCSRETYATVGLRWTHAGGGSGSRCRRAGQTTSSR